MTTNNLGIEKGKPLVLPNGTTITKREDGQTTIESKKQVEDAQLLDEILTDVFVDDEIETYQRTLADVLVTKQEFNPVMLILSYSMWGLEEDAIARYLDIPASQVEAIKNSDLYVRTRKELLESIRYAEASSIHGYLSAQAKNAARTVVNLLNSKSEDTRMTASKDILDRSGYRPADKVEHTHKFDDDLRIVHLHQAQPVDLDVGI